MQGETNVMRKKQWEEVGGRASNRGKLLVGRQIAANRDNDILHERLDLRAGRSNNRQSREGKTRERDGERERG